MDKKSVVQELGDPESVSLAFRHKQNGVIEVLDFRLYQYAGAIDGLSPYFDIYSLIFVNNELATWKKGERGSRLSESAALHIVDNLYTR